MSNPYRKTRQGYYIASFHSGGEFSFDAVDLPLVLQHTWHYGKRGYPATHSHGKTVVLHRLMFPNADGELDHINGDKLDNRRSNLRIVTHQQNAYNQRRRRTNTSGYIGVSHTRELGSYEAYIHHQGRKYHLGIYNDPISAATARDGVARILFGDYARLNFKRRSCRKHGSG